MQFTELTYEVQRKVLDRLGDAMLKEPDEFLQFAIASAIVELEMWSNAPIPEPRQKKEETNVISNQRITPEFLKSLQEDSTNKSDNSYIAEAFDQLEDD